MTKNGIFITYVDVTNVLRDTPITKFEYNIVKNALHNIQLANTYPSMNNTIYFNNKPLSIQTSKEIRQLYVESKYNSNHVKSINNWIEIYGESVFDNNTWKLSMTVIKEVKLFIMQWKILHQIYPTNNYLFKIQLSETNTCE